MIGGALIILVALSGFYYWRTWHWRRRYEELDYTMKLGDAVTRYQRTYEPDEESK